MGVSMITCGVSDQTSHEVLGHHVVLASQSFKTVDVVSNYLLAKNHGENILKGTLYAVGTLFLLTGILAVRINWIVKLLISDLINFSARYLLECKL